MCIACIVWMVRLGTICMDIQPGGFIQITLRVCLVIGIGDIQTPIPQKTLTRHDPRSSRQLECYLVVVHENARTRFDA